MSDDISVQILAQNQANLENRIESLFGSHNIAMQKIVVLESRDVKFLDSKISECEKEISSIDKRLTGVESSSGQNQDRWNKIMSFVIQLVWVILAAWLLMKLNIQAPAVP